MKQYPKIDHIDKNKFGNIVWAFSKIDGTNIRCEFSRKNGWNKFGTKQVIINETDPNYGESIPLFMEKYSSKLEKIFKSKYPNVEKITVFCEFFGENSFAGRHNITDKKDIILFDVDLYESGFIFPKEFVHNFGHLHIPDVIYKGIYDINFVENVKNNIWNLNEGVVCKGVINNKLFMNKIKTKKWLNKIKYFSDKEMMMEELDNNIDLFNYYND